MIVENVPSNAQARYTTNPKDADGDVVALDPGAYTTTVVSGNGTFEYNAATNGLVFRLEDDATGSPVTRYEVRIDGQPGSGVVQLLDEVELTCVPPVADPATVLGSGLAIEAKGTPA